MDLRTLSPDPRCRIRGLIVLTRQTGNVKESWAQKFLELGKGSHPLVEGFLAMAGLGVVFIPVFGFGKHSKASRP